MTRPVRWLLGVALAVAWWPAPPASAGLIVYNAGADYGVGPNAPAASMPNYELGLQAFVRDVAVFNTTTFEGIPTGPSAISDPNATRVPTNYGPVVVDPTHGVTVTYTNVDPVPPAGLTFGVASDNPTATLGYNTTAGGSQFLRLAPFPAADTPTSVTFNLGVGVTAFGFSVTGLNSGPSQLHLTFDSGGVRQDVVANAANAGPNAAGGILFLGVSGLTAPVSTFTLTVTGGTSQSRDIIGIDDVRFAPVPEPASFALLALGGLTALALRRRLGRG